MSLCEFSPVFHCPRCQRERLAGEIVNDPCPLTAGEPCDWQRFKHRHRCRHCNHRWLSSRPSADLPPRRCPSLSAPVLPLAYDFALAEPCIHRGEVVGALECAACGVEAPVPVAECDIYGFCTGDQVRAKFDDKIPKGCRRCRRRVATSLVEAAATLAASTAQPRPA